MNSQKLKIFKQHSKYVMRNDGDLYLGIQDINGRFIRGVCINKEITIYYRYDEDSGKLLEGVYAGT